MRIYPDSSEEKIKVIFIRDTADKKKGDICEATVGIDILNTTFDAIYTVYIGDGSEYPFVQFDLYKAYNEKTVIPLSKYRDYQINSIIND